MGSKSTAIEVTDTAQRVDDAVGEDRALGQALMIQNLGDAVVYYGAANVTELTGIQLEVGGLHTLPLGFGDEVYVVTETGTADLRVFELGVA